MNKTVVLIVSFVFSWSLALAQSQYTPWAKSFGGTGDDICRDLAMDNIGNLYISGIFSDTVDFDPGPGIEEYTAKGPYDIFIQKFDPYGNQLWVKRISGDTMEFVQAISYDNSGHLIVAGYFRDSVDFNPGGTPMILDGGFGSMFIQKMDTSGNVEWVKSFIGAKIGSITADLDGSIYISGSNGGVVDFDPNVGIVNIASNGDWDIFILKLDSSGNYLWVKSVGGVDEDNGYEITVDDHSNIYITGSFIDTVDFDPNAGVHYLSSQWSSFILKLDSLGDFVWVKALGLCQPNSLVVDSSDNVLMTGYFFGTNDFDPGPGVDSLTSNGERDIFVQKLDSLGNYLWARSMGGENYDNSYSINVDSIGNCYITACYTNDTIDADPGPGILNFGFVWGCDILFQKLDVNGNLIWAKSIGGTGMDHAMAAVFDDAENLFVTGFYGGEIDMDPGNGVLNLSSNGQNDVFISHWRTCSSLNFISQSSCDSFLWSANGITYHIEGNYSAILSASTGCDSVVALELMINSVDTSLIQNGNELVANASGALYQWLDCTNAYTSISGATSQTFVPLINGSYAVEIIENGCMDTSACIIISTLEQLKVNYDGELVLYPNPTTGELNLKLSKRNSGCRIEVRNVVGELIGNYSFSKSEPIRFTIDGVRGFYLIEVIYKEKRCYSKVLKH